jgi:hypothetical protein
MEEISGELMSYLEVLQETFENLDALDADKIGKLAQESATFFREIQTQMMDPSTQAEAERSAQEVKDYLEGQLKEFSADLDLDNLPKMAMPSWEAFEEQFAQANT